MINLALSLFDERTALGPLPSCPESRKRQQLPAGFKGSCISPARGSNPQHHQQQPSSTGPPYRPHTGPPLNTLGSVSSGLVSSPSFSSDLRDPLLRAAPPACTCRCRRHQNTTCFYPPQPGQKLLFPLSIQHSTAQHSTSDPDGQLLIFGFPAPNARESVK